MFLAFLIAALLIFFLGLIVGITIGPEVHNMVVRATLEQASDEDRKRRSTLPTTPSGTEPLISDEGFWISPPKPKRQNKRKRK